MITIALLKILRFILGPVLFVLVFAYMSAIVLASPSTYRELKGTFWEDAYDMYTSLAIGG